ncbi:hypothetical protein BDY21DRAFT_351530 [Lineolata rhizophorae]|uniref:Uncharacterized protein n=1 Tax=Lineolata rhizophorae TaxID=578093 RepID=A0A6A6NUT5_9PEZI|nr:hypothetical protein BDY21DRAFT_351530 [Lineolata rhizophorae]
MKATASPVQPTAMSTKAKPSSTWGYFHPTATADSSDDDEESPHKFLRRNLASDMVEEARDGSFPPAAGAVPVWDQGVPGYGGSSQGWPEQGGLPHGRPPYGGPPHGGPPHGGLKHGGAEHDALLSPKEISLGISQLVASLEKGTNRHNMDQSFDTMDGWIGGAAEKVSENNDDSRKNGGHGWSPHGH